MTSSPISNLSSVVRSFKFFPIYFFAHEAQIFYIFVVSFINGLLLIFELYEGTVYKPNLFISGILSVHDIKDLFSK